MKRILALFLLLSLLKTLYVYYVLFNQINILHLLLTETGYFLFLISIFAIVKSKNVYFSLLIYDFVLSIVFLSILTYTYYFNQIPTYNALGNAGQLGKVFDSVLSLIKLRDFILFIDLPFLILLSFFKNVRIIKIPRKRSLIIFSFGIVWMITSFLAFYKPSVTNSNLAIANDGLFNYQVAAVNPPNEEVKIKSVVKNLSDAQQLNQKIRQLKGINLPKKPQYYGIDKDKNLIVIQVEAMENFVLNLSIDGQKVTPFLDSWIDQKEATHFDRVFEQIGPGNTSDAEFMMNTSLYPDGQKATTNQFESTPFPSLPKLLNNAGYQTATMHADEIHFWNRIHLYPNLGWGKYYDKSYFGTEDKIGMGASDRVLFKKGLEAMGKMDQPFYTQIVTLSSHHPFKIPEKYQELKLPDSIKGTLTGNYLESMHYVDNKLKVFIDDLKEKGLYSNSIIMLYGDHFGLGSDTTKKAERDYLATLLNHPYTFIDQFNIPFIIHAPGITGGVNHQLGTQTDFLPTVANLLGVNLQEYIHFGDDLFNIKHNFFGMRFYMPTGSFFTDNKVFFPGVGFEDGKMYDLTTGKEIPKTKKDEKLFKNIIEIESISDDFLRSLPTSQ